MKNWPILLLSALLVGAVGVWGLTSWLPSSDHTTVEDEPPVQDAGQAQGQAPADTGAKTSGSSANSAEVALPTGPSWTPRNPWYETRGIGRRTQPPAKGAVVFPDGTWLPVLNGVDNPPPYPGFSRGYPYAPVTQIVTDDKGVQWYIHADGSRSSPQNMEYSEGGKKLGTRPGWAVGNPYDKKPVVGPDGKVEYEPRKSPPPKIRNGSGG
mgnify:CR=1 FL=1